MVAMMPVLPRGIPWRRSMASIARSKARSPAASSTLGADDRPYARPGRGQVRSGFGRLGIDSQQNVAAAIAERCERPRQGPPRFRLAGRSDPVFEVHDDRVGAPLVRSFDASAIRGRHEQQRTPAANEFRRVRPRAHRHFGLCAPTEGPGGFRAAQLGMNEHK